MNAYQCDRCGLYVSGCPPLTKLPMGPTCKLLDMGACEYELCPKCAHLLEDFLAKYLIDATTFDKEEERSEL